MTHTSFDIESLMDVNSFVGPWIYDMEMADGNVVRFGYEGMAEVEYPDRWDAEYAGFEDQQSDLDSLDRRCIKALANELKAERQARMSRIILWLANANAKVLKKNRRTFWLRVLDSRKHCSETGLWYHVYLTKAQVDTIFAAFEWRMAGNTL